MKLQRTTCTITKISEDEAKAEALTSHIMHRISLEDERINELSEDERVIYCGERLAGQINMSGFSNFFEYGIALIYEPVVKMLQKLGATDLEAALRASKAIYMGDRPVTPDTLAEAEEELFPDDWDGKELEWKKRIMALKSREAERDFHDKLWFFKLRHFEAAGYELDPP
jgi:Domain of unknown function (DUF4375)